MKRILKRVAFFGYHGCLTQVAIAYQNNPDFYSRQEGKGVFSTVKTEQKESLVESHTHDNGYELTLRATIFNHFID